LLKGDEILFESRAVSPRFVILFFDGIKLPFGWSVILLELLTNGIFLSKQGTIPQGR